MKRSIEIIRREDGGILVEKKDEGRSRTNDSDGRDTTRRRPKGRYFIKCETGQERGDHEVMIGSKRHKGQAGRRDVPGVTASRYLDCNPS